MRIRTWMPTERRVLRLMTLRSDDQFNTTIYTLDDRFRGVFGTRRVVFDESARHRAAGVQGGRSRHRLEPSRMMVSARRVPGFG